MLSLLKSKLKQEKCQSNESQTQDASWNPKAIAQPVPVSISFQVQESSALCLPSFRVPSLDSVFYVPGFLSAEESSCLFQNISNGIYNHNWVSLPKSQRRLLRFGGEVTPQGLDLVEELPLWCQELGRSLDQRIGMGVLGFGKEGNEGKELNHALVNEYEKGIGIMPHSDGPLYFPVVCIISLGSSCSFNFYENYGKYKEEESAGRLFIEEGSLLVFRGKCYEEYLHTIPDSIVDEMIIWKDEKEEYQSSYVNFKQTKFFKENEEQIASEIEKEGIFSKSIPRSKRISITLRHVFPKSQF